jgi:hypothetical protein
MKNFKFSLAWLTVLALVFTSCSKEESGVVADDQELIQLSFGSALSDFNDQNKQATPVECREGTPSYVMIGITDDMGNYIGEDDGDDNPDVNLIEVGLKWNSSLEIWETVYSEDLALPAGDYHLQHFIVYDTEGEVLWVAPRDGGSFADYVDNALPIPLTLAAGTKPYINVEVLCYFSRNEDAYGYVFFDITPVPVENSYCVFVNYCDGREYPAYFNIDVYTDEAMTQEWEINESMNSVSMVGGWPSATVLCFALPDLGDQTLYARVTVMDHDDLDYTADADAYYDFEITQSSIEALENQVPAYHHVRINCDEDDNGGGDDGCDLDAACVLDDSPLDANCYYTELEGAVVFVDNKYFLEIDEASDLEGLNLLVDFGPDEILAVASVDITMNGGVEVSLDTDLETSAAEDRITGFAIELRPSENGMISETCWESECANVIGDNQYGMITENFNGFDYSYPFYISIDAIFCQTVIAPQ